MNLIIDIGNSRVKWDLFEKNKLIASEISDTEINLSIVNRLLKEFSFPEQIILSSVRKYSDEINSFLHKQSKLFVCLSHQTPLPITNTYASPKTLGLDRLAAAVGASECYPGKTSLIIDAGTAITFDILNAKREFTGGNISPGLKMRFQALNHYTCQLPLLENSANFSFMGTNTETAIINGVQNGIIFEIESYIEHTRKKFGEITTILTGGDCEFLYPFLKNDEILEPHLTTKGLNAILNYQKHSKMSI